jgi:ribosomal protein L1
LLLTENNNLSVGGRKIAACTTKEIIMAEEKKKTSKRVASSEQENKAKAPKELVAEVTETVETVEVSTEPKATAKAGKRSEKAIKEVEEKVAKEERKAKAKEEQAEADAKPKQIAKPARSRLERRSKGYRKAAESIEKGKEYGLKEALGLAAKTSSVKFDASIELHVRLGVDPRQADQNIRQNVVLPGGTGKTVRVAVFADVDDVAKAKKAGADVAGSDEFLQQLDKGVIDFDILVATPAMMPKLGKYARVLGPKGLMPNPKSGTVAADVAKAVTEAKAGKVEYRVDSTGIVHLGIGKVSFDADKLLANARAVLDSIKAAKPASVKGTYVKSVFITSSMGPSIPVAVNEA